MRYVARRRIGSLSGVFPFLPMPIEAICNKRLYPEAPFCFVFRTRTSRTSDSRTIEFHQKVLNLHYQVQRVGRRRWINGRLQGEQ